jgi:16S rRNA (guanine966-N2)-methyltransferase
MLGPVSGAVALDLYAGTGALGIEALSRGAARAVFVESARPALAAIRENVAALAIEGRVRVLAQPVLHAAPALSRAGPFDLVLIDPPYADLPEVTPVIKVLGATCALTPDARVVVEHATRDPAPELAGLTRLAARAYGDTSVAIYRATPTPGG